MAVDSMDIKTDEHPAASESGGLAYRAALRLGFEHANVLRSLRSVPVLALITWLPLLLLTFPAGIALGARVEVPLLRDPGFYSRYFVVLPLLVFAEMVVTTSLAVHSGYLLESGIVPESERSGYAAAQAELKGLYGSRVAQGVILIVAYLLVITFRTVVAYSPGSSSWERLASAEGAGVTLAGWWSILVCLPVLVFLLLRWFWRTCVWAWFLFRVSRLDLELTPTHPDRAGGLGFLTWGQAGFAPVLAAVSALLAGSFAAEVLYGGQSVNGLKYHLAVFVGLSLAFLLAPLLLFSGRLAHCRLQALLDFGMLVWRHDRAFDDRWIKALGTKSEIPLGSPDVSSLADLAVSFEHVNRMRAIPLDHRAVLVLFLAAAVPMLPFVATAIPLAEILKDLAEFVV